MEDNKLSYFLFGLGMGVAIGVLFAPKSGEETREMLKSRAGEGRDYLRRRGEEAREQASDLVGRGREAFQSQRENLSAALDAGREAYRQSVAGPGGAPEGGTGA